MAIAEGDYTGSTGGKVEDNSLGRLLTLSDDVFAIATTLLALDLRVPELPDPVTNTALLDELGRELPSILTVLLSLYVVARYWFSHHRLSRWSPPPIPGCCAAHPALWLVVAVMPVLDEPPRVSRSRSLCTGVVKVLAVLRLWLRHDVESFPLAAAPADLDQWRRSDGAARQPRRLPAVHPGGVRPRRQATLRPCPVVLQQPGRTGMAALAASRVGVIRNAIRP
ncbi:MAG: potassium channel family protein [Pseudonocardiales bacterium]|jgi:Endosomal/lysosomal potassium channel TMEM175|nr:potassium channel family protein [Pseudonocardiales bacterium]